MNAITRNALNAVANTIGSKDKHEVMTLSIKLLIEAGVDAERAIDFVLGDGTTQKMISEIKARIAL